MEQGRWMDLAHMHIKNVLSKAVEQEIESFQTGDVRRNVTNLVSQPFKEIFIIICHFNFQSIFILFTIYQHCSVCLSVCRRS